MDEFYFDKPNVLAIEEPIFSWGRKNPRAFHKQTILFSMICGKFMNDLNPRVYVVNPRTMKLLFTGDGKADKRKMVVQADKYYRFAHANIKNAKYKEAISDAIGIGVSVYRKMDNPPRGIYLLGSL